jgi:hypothetical protein
MERIMLAACGVLLETGYHSCITIQAKYQVFGSNMHNFSEATARANLSLEKGLADAEKALSEIRGKA